MNSEHVLLHKFPLSDFTLFPWNASCKKIRGGILYYLIDAFRGFLPSSLTTTGQEAKRKEAFK